MSSRSEFSVSGKKNFNADFTHQYSGRSAKKSSPRLSDLKRITEKTKDLIYNKDYNLAVRRLDDFQKIYDLDMSLVESQDLYFYLGEAIYLSMKADDKNDTNAVKQATIALQTYTELSRAYKTTDDKSKVIEAHVILIELYLKSANKVSSINQLMKLKSLLDDGFDYSSKFLTIQAQVGMTEIMDTFHKSKSLIDVECCVEQESNDIEFLKNFNTLFTDIFGTSFVETSSLVHLALDEFEISEETFLSTKEESNVQLSLFLHTNAENSLEKLKLITKHICNRNYISVVVHNPYNGWPCYKSMKKLKKRYHVFYGNVKKKNRKSFILFRMMNVDDRVKHGNYTDKHYNDATFVSKKHKLPLTVISFTSEKQSCDCRRALQNISISLANTKSPIIAAFSLSNLKQKKKNVFIQMMEKLSQKHELTLLKCKDEMEYTLEQIMQKNNDHLIFVNDSFMQKLDCGRLTSINEGTDPYLQHLNVECCFDYLLKS